MPFPWEGPKRFLIRAKEPEGPWGKRPEERTVDELLRASIINLDKPPGPTSHEVVAWVRKILGVKKAGHGGTLDPGATGVLPVGVNAGTKVLQALLSAGKEYVCIMHLHGDVPEEKIREVIEEFTGDLYQRPPVKSAVRRRLRVRKVYYMDLIEVDGRDVVFRAGTSAGTYIRKLCHDMGLALGVGAHMAELRRTKVGGYSEDFAVTLHDVVDAYHFWKENGLEEPIRKVLLPVESAVVHLPKIVIRDSAVAAITHGADLAVPGILEVQEGIKPGDMVAIMTKKGELVALAKALMDSESMVEEDRGYAADVERVIMDQGVYPPMWKKKQDAGGSGSERAGKMEAF
ncbi:MAG TPA: RNA-guided pseudouridylation complex pseudouridine synthase subunit Cbf5 [Euryarchaeota archaeon]|nr:RNA-guided pseudouridylation complex pseudouridine synthase subunit Cbf5 [Euryarchaeota archaeon]